MARQAIMVPPIAAAITTRIEDMIGVVWAWQSLSQTSPTQRTWMNSRVRSLGITIRALRFSRPRRGDRRVLIRSAHQSDPAMKTSRVVFNLKYGDTPWTGTELKVTGKSFKAK